MVCLWVWGVVFIGVCVRGVCVSCALEERVYACMYATGHTLQC